MLGSTISHYRITGKLGTGGMGVVYEAEDTRLPRKVALKFLPEPIARNTEARRRFQWEARAASALNHPNICTIHDVGEQDGRTCMVMEYLEGTTLKHRIAERPLGIEELVRFGVEIAEALEAAHAEGITHRDYVTQAWTKNPIEQVLVKMAAPSMRVAAGTAPTTSR